MSPKQHRRSRKRQVPETGASKYEQPGQAAPAGTEVPLSGSRSVLTRHQDIFIALGVFVIFLIIYLLTASRSVPPGDSGELITAAWTLGVAHPPGYPTFTLLSHLAGYLPLGSPALRLNILSAVLDALALGILSWGILRFFSSTQKKFRFMPHWLVPLTGVVAGTCLLGVTRVFWLYSTAAEVFALNNLFAAITLVLLLEWVRQPVRKRYLYLCGLFAGLGLTNQQTFILLAPGFLTLLAGGIMRWRKHAREGLIAGTSPTREPGWLTADIAITAGFFILGLLPYIYLPIAANLDPAFNWGNPGTLSGFWQSVTRSDYGTFSLTANSAQGNPLQQLLYFGGHLLQDFTIPGVLLAVLGLVWFIRKRKLEGGALFLCLFFSGPVFAMFANPQLDVPLTLGVFERFYILPGLFMAWFIAAGSAYLMELVVRVMARFKAKVLQLSAIAAVLCAAVAWVIILALVNLPAINLSNNRVVEEYAQDLLEPLEPNALLIMSQDYNGSAVMYAQLVSGIRMDVVALHTELLKAPWYVAQQRHFHPEITIPFDIYDEGRSNSLADLVKANIGQRPVYAAGEAKEDISGVYDGFFWGLSRRFKEKTAGADTFSLMRTESARFAGLHYPETTYPQTSWEHYIAEQYGSTAFVIATANSQTEAQTDFAAVARLYRIAILNFPENASSYRNLGMLLWKNGGSRAEISELWEKYFSLAPKDPDIPYFRSIIETLK